MINIIIIGLGNIGFYHLYSICNQNNFKFKIYVVDKNINILENIKKKKFTNIQCFKKLNQLPQIKFDILILSTTSNERFTILKDFVNLYSVKYILFEKIAFNSLKEIKKAKKILANKKIKSWINCNYQSIPFFRDLVIKLNKKKFELKIFGGNWALGTSSIHFLDLFTYLSQKDIDRANKTTDLSGATHLYRETPEDSASF